MLSPLGEPMVGIDVRAVVSPNVVQALAQTRTDGNGYFVLSRLPLRTLLVLATAPGHTTGLTSVQLTSDQPIGGALLRLWPACGVRGRVVDEGGAPVADAVVLGTKDFTWFDGGFLSPETRTDADGKFALSGIPIGDQVVRVWKPGFVMREQELFATADTATEVRLARGAGVELRARVEGVARDLLPGVEVSLYPTRGGSGFSFPRAIERGGRLDAEGNWLLAGMPDCEWNVELGSADYTFDPRSIRTKAGVAVQDLGFRATKLGEVQLQGILTTADQKPLAGETLVCRTRRSQSMNGGRPGICTTDAGGRFTLVAPLVAGEPYSLHLVGSRFVLQQVKAKEHVGMHDARYLVRYEDTAAVGRSLTLVAVRAAFVRGSVVDAAGVPVPFCWCMLQVSRGNQWTNMAYATSDRNGGLVFPGVHAVDSELRIAAAGQVGSAYSAPFHAQVDTETTAVVEVPQPGRVQGVLADADGRPLPGSRLMVQNFHLDSGHQIDGSWTNVMTDQQGRYAFVGVSPTGHRISVLRGTDRLFTTDLFGVAAGQTVDLDIHLPADAGAANGAAAGKPK